MSVHHITGDCGIVEIRHLDLINAIISRIMKSLTPVVISLFFASLPALAAMHLASLSVPSLEMQMRAVNALHAES